ncbi:hypothetical protein [Pectobacterium aroidearum]|uniref:hypothetical protein n=1 Tax=Pectobacterium aroidearum TaxID=1201031 RepID=UPI0015F067B9|nr:hypothetical protein [Pectobacterium aroidearum]MBA5238625.1 hypothetical protein [Pectobacterium aroidearum]MDY4386777.1 hypothetical protein [Pectobacterium aroidearum]
MTTFLDPDKIGRTFFIAPAVTAEKRVICGADGRNVDGRVALVDVSITQREPYLVQQGGASHH